MSDVIEVNEIITFAQNKDHCLKEVGELTKVIPPTKRCNLKHLKSILRILSVEEFVTAAYSPLKELHDLRNLLADIDNCNQQTMK